MISYRLAGVAAAVVLACTATQGAAQTRQKFDFWHGLTGDLGEAVNDVCKRFNDSQQAYEVVCVSQGTYDAALQNTIAAFRAGKQPTVVQISDAGTADIMLSGAYYPANKLMADNSVNIDWKDYFPGIARYYATSKGEMYSFPFNSSTALWYWNKDAFAKIGKTEGPKTWEEVDADAKALKAAGYDCPIAINLSRDEIWQYLEQFSAIHNIPVATKNNGYDGLDAELAFNKSKFVQFISDMKRWYDEGLAKIKSKEGGQNMVEAFASGTCQMMTVSVANHGTVTSTAKPGLNWDVVMLPVYAGTERKNSLVGGASLWTLAGKKPEEYKAAAAFFAFLAKPEEALFWSTRTGYIPVTNSGFEYMKKQGFYDKSPYKGREIAIASLTASEPTAVTRGMRLGGLLQIRNEVAVALQEIFANNRPVQAALDDAVVRGNTILRRFEKTYEGKQLP